MTASKGGSLTASKAPEGMDVWAVGPNDFGGVVGTRYSYVCTANGDDTFAVWGTGPFTDDSSICAAAVFAGLITSAKGGTVSLEVQNGSSTYGSGTANGVTTNDYGSWPTQFVFVK